MNLPASHPDSTIAHNLIIKKGHIWLPRGLPMIPTLLTEYHSTPTGEHMGVAKIVARISANFYWSGLRDDVA